MAGTGKSIDLVFGVAGGSSVSGQSGATIQKQLDELSKHLKISIANINLTKEAKQSLKKQVEDVINKMGIDLTVKAAQATEAAKNATKNKTTDDIGSTLKNKDIRAVTTQLTELDTFIQKLQHHSLLIDYDANAEGIKKLTDGAGGLSTIMQQIKSVFEGANYDPQLISADAADQVKNLVAEMQPYINTMRALKDQVQANNAIAQSQKGIRNFINDLNNFEKKQTKRLILFPGFQDQIDELRNEAQKCLDDFQGIDNVRLDQLKTQFKELQTTMQSSVSTSFLNTFNATLTRVVTGARSVKKQDFFNLSAIDNQTLLNYVENVDKLKASIDGIRSKYNGDLTLVTPDDKIQLEQYYNELVRLDNILKEIAAANKNARADIKNVQKARQVLDRVNQTVEKLGDNLDDYPQLSKDFQELGDEIRKALSAPDTINDAVINNWIDRMRQLTDATHEADVATDTLAEELRDKLFSEARKRLIDGFLNLIRDGLRDIIKNVVELDTAMTELRKVTDATEGEYERFLDKASERAAELGVTLTEVVNATADFARLGYNIDEASNIADAALIYRNVGDDVTGIDMATEHLISTMTAFGYTASEVIHIVDVFNEVSNKQAVSAGDIGEGLQRSAAALAAGGNTLEQSVALFTAADTIAQDAERTGTALKTMTARIRGAADELKGMDDSLEGSAQGLAKLRKTVQDLSGVDIMADEATFKSTYDIMKEISLVWDDLTDKQQAALATELFGKTQFSIGLGLLNNFDIAEETLAQALNSAGSAVKENEVFVGSIQGRLQKLQAVWQAFSQDFFNSDLIKGAVSLLTDVVRILDVLIDKLGPLGTLLDISLVSGGVMVLDDVLTKFGNIGKKDGQKAVSVLERLMILLKGEQGVKGSGLIGQVTKAFQKLSNVTTNISTKQWETLKDIDVSKSTNSVNNLKDSLNKLKKAFSDSTGKAGDFIKSIGGAKIAAGFVAAGLLAIVSAGIAINKEADPSNLADYYDELENTVQQDKNKIEELRTALEDNKKAIQERRDLIEADGGQLVGDAELEKLKRENILLQSQINYQEALLKLDEQKQLQAAYNRYGKQEGVADFFAIGSTFSYSSEGKKIATGDPLSSIENLYNGLQRYNKLLADENNKGEAADTKRIKRYTEKIAELEVLYTQEVQQASETLDLLADQTDSASITIKDKIQGILDAFGNFFGDVEDKAGTTAEADLTAIFDTMDLSILDEANDELSKLHSNLKLLSDAFAEQNENGRLSIDTALSLIDAGMAEGLVIDQNTGAITLNSNAYEKIIQAKIADTKATLALRLADLQEAEAMNESAIAAYKAAGEYDKLAVAEANAARFADAISNVSIQLSVIDNLDFMNVTSGLYGIGAAASSANSAVSALRDALSTMQSGLSGLLSTTVSWLKQQDDDYNEAARSAYESQREALEDSRDAADDYWDDQIDQIKDAQDAYQDLIDAQIEALRREKEADDYERSKNDKVKAVTDIQNQLDAIANDNSAEAQKMRLQLQEQLAEAQEELDEFQLDHEYDMREQALEDEKDQYDRETDARIKALEAQREAEREAYDARIEQLRNEINAIKDNAKSEAYYRALAADYIENRSDELYANLIAWNREYGDGLDSTIDFLFEDSAGWQQYGSTVTEALDNMARKLRELEDAEDGVGAATVTLLDYLKKLQTEAQKAGDEALATAIGNTIEILQKYAEADIEIITALQNSIAGVAAKQDEEVINSLNHILESFLEFKDNGLTITDSMQQSMSSIITNGTNEEIDALSGLLDAFNIVAKSGVSNLEDLSDEQKGVLQATYDNISKLSEDGQKNFYNLFEAFIEDLKVVDASQAAVFQAMFNNIQQCIAAQKQLEAANNALTYDPKTIEYLNNGGSYGSTYKLKVTNDTGKSAPGLSTGGVVDYTGPANVHGKTNAAEVMFNAADAKKLYNYVHTTPDLLANALGLHVGQTRTHTNNSVGDININIAGNADATTVKQLKEAAAAIKKEVIDSLNDGLQRRGVVRSPRVV